MNIQEFIASAGITMTAAAADSNPFIDDDRNPMDHWKCTLRSGRSRMMVYFSMGSGHNGKQPDATDVLDCLASDASTVDNARGFDDWCGDLGYDTDSRRAERTYKTCRSQAARLRAFLGDSAYQTLLSDVERL